MSKKIVILLASLIVAPAFAHDGMHGPGGEFDADEDGVLSLEEFEAYLKDSGGDLKTAKAQFKALDTNEDGGVSQGELARGARKAAAR
ncbi:MAG: hypothetical protein ABW136_02925 [Steroidobacteraceae bacterium]